VNFQVSLRISELKRDCAMHNEHNHDLPEIWRAAQLRRTEDLTGWLSQSLKRSDIPRQLMKPRLALARGMTIAIITFAAITSVSAVVHAKKSPHVALIGPIPAVSVP
jgi:hypothetical protein